MKQQPINLFTKKNLYLMLAGLGLIILGILLMLGGRSESPEVFDAEAIYSFRRITLAPILMLAGFALEIVAILYRPKKKK